ncbi:MAG: hypothetical protein HY347_12145 [candidate division NC10 bacterium]|nr:hypothetical protein [candidate division NC10 bacterium]
MGGSGRDYIEARYGKLGDGATILLIEGRSYTLLELLEVLGLHFEDIRPIDACVLADEDLYAIRYFDSEERRIVAYEFDRHFRYVREVSAHIAEWLGEDESF